MEACHNTALVIGSDTFTSSHVRKFAAARSVSQGPLARTGLATDPALPELSHRSCARSFQPSRSWRMALGARNGAVASGLEVRDMHLAASPYFDANAVAVEVTANEVDFTGDGVQLALRRRWRPAGTISPGSGSNRGGTSLTLTGDHLRGGDAYRIALQSSGAAMSSRGKSWSVRKQTSPHTSAST